MPRKSSPTPETAETHGSCGRASKPSPITGQQHRPVTVMPPCLMCWMCSMPVWSRKWWGGKEEHPPSWRTSATSDHSWGQKDSAQSWPAQSCWPRQHSRECAQRMRTGRCSQTSLTSPWAAPLSHHALKPPPLTLCLKSHLCSASTTTSPSHSPLPSWSALRDWSWSTRTIHWWRHHHYPTPSTHPSGLKGHLHQNAAHRLQFSIQHNHPNAPN